MKNRYIAILIALLCLLFAFYILGEVKQENTVKRHPVREEQTVIMR